MPIEFRSDVTVELVRAAAQDADVLFAARVSTQGEQSLGDVNADASRSQGLINYLMRDRHGSPFEHNSMTFYVQAPIFVFREWHRHRTQSYNEMSARYTPLPDLNYVPTVERLMINSKTNKQAGTATGASELTREVAEHYREELLQQYEADEQFYQRSLVRGVPKELARIHLPVGRYSKMRASTCLRNWLAFLTLRMAPGAQYEIRVYANAVGDLIQQNFPRTWELFAESKGAS